MIGAVDIGGTKVAVGMVEREGRLLVQDSINVNRATSATQGVDRILQLLRQTAHQTGRELEGVGIGCTGPVNPHSGVLGPIEFLPDWEGVNLAGIISQEMGVTATLENDADAAALGEATWGAGKGSSRFLLITVGTGIGGGMVLDGRLYRGVDGCHPEMGHHVIDPSGPLCFCGASGCWESLASGPAMEGWFNQETQADGRWDARRICTAADEGHSRARAAVERTGKYLGIGLANLVTLLCPEVIALSGGLMRRLDLFRGQIENTIRTHCGLVPYEKTRLLPTGLGTDANLIGAAQVWLHRQRA